MQHPLQHREVDASGSTHSCELLATREHLAKVHCELEQLLERTGAPPSARWETIEPWFRHHPGLEPWGVLVRSEGEVVAAALLAHGIEYGVHRFASVGPVAAANCLPATTPAAAKSLARAVRRALDATGRPWKLHLRDLPSEDLAIDALRAELAFSKVELGPPMSRLFFSPGEPLSSYVTRNTKSAAAKALNRIKVAGLPCELSWTRDPADIDAMTHQLIDVHRRRGHQRSGASPLDDPTATALFIDIVHAHAHANRVRLLTLRINGQLAAFALCEVAAGTLWVDTNRASPDWLEFSPGTIVNAEVVRAAHADPMINCVDWGGGLQRYKLSGRVTIIRFQSLQAWSSPRVRQLVSCKRFLKQVVGALQRFVGCETGGALSRVEK